MAKKKRKNAAERVTAARGRRMYHPEEKKDWVGTKKTNMDGPKGKPKKK